jgi:hypothetical protein
MDEDEILRRMELICDNIEMLDILKDGDRPCWWSWERLMEMTCSIEFDDGDDSQLVR